MKIAHFIYDHVGNPWLGGGGAVREKEINKRLVEKGDEVHVICGGYLSKSNADWNEDGVWYHSCCSSRNYAMSRLLYSWQCRKRFLDLNRLMRFDVVVDDTSAFSFSAPWLVWKGPMVAIVHHILANQLNEKMGKLFGAFFKCWEMFNLRKYKRIVVVSKGTKEALQRIIKKTTNINVVYNGVNFVDPVECVARKNNLILYIGRIDIFNKGIDDLLFAFERLYSLRSDFSLVIVGGGKDVDQLDLLIKKSPASNAISCYGFVSEEEKRQLLLTASFVVMPSRYEGWGIVAIEAAALGCPVIGRDIPGLNEAIENGSTGWLFKDKDALVSVMRDVALNKVVVDSERLHQFAEKFRWSVSADHMREILNSEKEMR